MVVPLAMKALQIVTIVLLMDNRYIRTHYKSLPNFCCTIHSVELSSYHKKVYGPRIQDRWTK